MSATTTSPHNAAAWSLHAKTRPLVVSSAPYTSPLENNVVIKVHCLAINPIDWILQDQDVFKLKYPAILGSDVAGEIVEVGEGDVKGLRVGMRVIAHANGTSTSHPSHGAFQHYSVVPALTTAPIPPHLSFKHATVLPLSLTTAACGLYLRNNLALPFPSSPPQKNLTRTLLIWGGSSSIGSTATQLAVSSGADVIVTASPRNAAYCKRLGAREVFDYHDDGVEEALISALQGRTLAGIFHAAGGEDAVLSCARVAERSEGKAIVVSVKPGKAGPEWPGSVRRGAISASDVFVQGSEAEGVAGRVWGWFAPMALRRGGGLVAAPEPEVVGRGLRSVQRGLDVQRRGVSAAKVVVEGVEGDASRE